MKKYEYILFDADNTLFDFDQAEYLSFMETADKSGILFTEELYRTYSAINDSLWKDLERGLVTLAFLKTERFRRLLLSLGEADSDETLRRAENMRDTYISTLGQQTCMIEEAEEVCRYLSERYQMYIVTNGISKIQRSRFAKSVFPPYFKEMFVSEELGVAKPKREYYDRVIEAVGDPDLTKYLAIGDSLTSDCDGAISYGIDICRFNPHGKDAAGRVLTYDIEKLSDLYEIL